MEFAPDRPFGARAYRDVIHRDNVWRRIFNVRIVPSSRWTSDRYWLSVRRLRPCPRHGAASAFIQPSAAAPRSILFCLSLGVPLNLCIRFGDTPEASKTDAASWPIATLFSRRRHCRRRLRHRRRRRLGNRRRRSFVRSVVRAAGYGCRI